jgi:hypothetical protein
MAEDASPFDYFSASASGEHLVASAGSGDYDPEISGPLNAAIRNMEMVRRYVDAKAQQCRQLAGENFKVVKAGGPQRYRAYVAPANNEGVRDELSQSMLLKAALAMQGK